MKHPKRTLVALLVCVGVLCGALAALHFAPSGSSASSSASSSVGATLYSYRDTDLVKMTVKNSAGSYTIEPDAAATAKAKAAASSAAVASSAVSKTSSTPAASAVKTVFRVKELSGVAQSTDAVANAAQSGYSLAAVKTIGSVSELGNYGLASPAATVSCTYVSGGSVTLLVGSTTPLDTSARYVKLAGQDTVYAAAVPSVLMGGLTGYVSTQVTSLSTASSGSADSSGSAAAAASVFTRIDFTNGNGRVSLARSGQSWQVNSRPADQTAVGTLCSSLTAINADSVAALDPTATQLKTFGLSKPAAELDYTAASGSAALLVGAQKDTSRYVMEKGGRAVYLVSSESLSWLTQKAFDLRRTTLLENEQTDLAGVVLAGNGQSWDMVVTRTKNASSSTEDVTSYDYTTRCNGKKLTNESTYGDFFVKAAGLKILEDSAAAPAGSPVWTLTVSGYDSKIHHTYQFYRSGERRYLVSVDGTSFGLVNSTDVDALITAAKAVK